MCNFKDKLCANNVALLHEIEEIFPVKFEQWSEQHWGAVIKKNNNIGIVYHPSTFSDAKVAHELLHLKISSIMGDNIALLEKSRTSSNEIKNIFNHKVVEHFLNSYEHMKMFNMYKSMGFEGVDFFEDMGQWNDVSIFAEQIKKEGLTSKGSYNIRTLIQYIVKTISCLSFPLDSRWNKELKIFKRADATLYGIIKKYWDDILILPLTNESRKEMDNKHIEFIDNINVWLSNKKISF